MQAVYTNGNDASWQVILYDQWITDPDKSSDAYSYIKEARALPKTPPGPPVPKSLTLIEITVYSNRSVRESMPQVKATCRTLDRIFKEWVHGY